MMCMLSIIVVYIETILNVVFNLMIIIISGSRFPLMWHMFIYMYKNSTLEQTFEISWINKSISLSLSVSLLLFQILIREGMEEMKMLFLLLLLILSCSRPNFCFGVSDGEYI